MKNNEMESRGLISFNLSEKFADDHPVAATVIYLSPVIIPAICNCVKYIADKVVDCHRFDIMAEKGIAKPDDLEIIPNDNNIVA